MDLTDRTVCPPAIMVMAFLVLFGCQLIGESLHRALSVPMPGAVIGMLLLTLILLRNPSVVPEPVAGVARVLLQNLGLFFVPAGVGIVANWELIRQQWLPICAALIGSTALSLVATAFVVQFIALGTRPASVQTVRSTD